MRSLMKYKHTHTLLLLGTCQLSFSSPKAFKMSKSGKSRRRIRSACIQEIDSIEKGMYLKVVGSTTN